MDTIVIETNGKKATGCLYSDNRVATIPSPKKTTDFYQCRCNSRSAFFFFFEEEGCVKCNLCGRTIPAHNSTKRTHERARGNLHLIPAGQGLYELSTRLDPPEWAKVSSFFRYYDEEQLEDEDNFGMKPGWYTSKPTEVERVLRITTQTIAEQTTKAEAQRLKREKREKHLRKLKDAFRSAEKPVSCTEVEYAPKILGKPESGGTGEWFQVTPTHIWWVRNNGMDGDDWNLNNYKTGGAGAIAVRIPRTNEIENLVHCLEE